MSRQAGAVVVLLGIVAVIVLGYRLVSKQTKARVEEKQKTAFHQRLMARQVVCDECGAVSPMDVPHTERRRFQVCPECGAKKARPIVYFVCMNPECDRQLVRFANHVMEGSIFHQSPEGRPVCPICGRPDLIRPAELSIEHAKKIAKETGQEFP